MPEKTTSERLAFFSDAVFAVIITILALDLKPPPGAPGPSPLGTGEKRAPLPYRLRNLK